MVTVPETTPLKGVITPDVELMFAIDVLPEDHVPPADVDVKVVV